MPRCGSIRLDLYGNVQRAGKFNADYAMADLGKKVDRKKWGMNPQTVNAYNGFLENKIVFPAGILQAPFFDPDADDAVNYGAIGAVIGHEISHGFDDQGRKVDASGAVRDWWAAEDGKRFEERAKVLGAQYAKYRGGARRLRQSGPDHGREHRRSRRAVDSRSMPIAARWAAMPRR